MHGQQNIKKKNAHVNFHLCTVHLDIIKVFIKIGRVKSSTTCGCFIAKELYSHSVS